MNVDWLDSDKLRDQPIPEVPWVVQDFAARGCLTMLVGEPGQGKSYLALSLAAGVSRGQDAAGFEVPVMRNAAVFDAENGPGEVHRRMASLDYPDGLKVGITTAGFDLATKMYEVEEAGTELGCNLIVLDSLRTLWPGGDENDSDEVTKLLVALQQAARDTDTAIVVLHHRNKAGGYRGSAAMAAVPEILIHLGSHPRDKDTQRRSLWWEKCRVGKRPPKRWIRLDDGVHEAFAPSGDELWPEFG